MASAALTAPVPSPEDAAPEGAVQPQPLWVRNALLDPESEGAAVGTSLGLDRLKGIAHTEAERSGELSALQGANSGLSGCDRWPPELLLRWERGLDSGYVRGRCKATNLCRYCQRRYTAETVEMLILDALESTPVGWSVLTAREHLTRPEFNEHLRVVRQRLRRSYPTWEYFCAVEFQKRGGPEDGLHSNLIHKGLTRAEFPLFQAELVRLWCERVDAEPWGQWGKLAKDGVAVMKYVTKTLAHGLKAEQAPPIGWKGHRTSQSRGYLVRPASVMREEARASLQRRSTMARVEGDCPDLSAVEREELVAALLAEQAERWWCLIGPMASPEAADRLVAAGEIWREGQPEGPREGVI